MRLPIRISVSVTPCSWARWEIALKEVSATAMATSVRPNPCIARTRWFQDFQALTVEAQGFTRGCLRPRSSFGPAWHRLWANVGRRLDIDQARHEHDLLGKPLHTFPDHALAGASLVPERPIPRPSPPHYRGASIYRPRSRATPWRSNCSSPRRTCLPDPWR